MDQYEQFHAVSDSLNNRRNFLKGTLLFSAGAMLNLNSSLRAAQQLRKPRRPLGLEGARFRLPPVKTDAI